MNRDSMAKIMNNRIKLATLLFGLLSLFSIGCSNEQEIGAPPVDASGNAVLRLSVRAAGISTEIGADAENAIRSLRIFYFTENGSLFASHYYEPKDLMSELPTDPKKAYDYYIKDGDSYVISKLFAKEVPLKVIVVANELSSLNGITKIEDIRGAVLRYYDTYNNSNRLNIEITGTGNTNRGFIPMYSESALMSVYEWDASNGKTVRMDLKRSLAKVTVKIKKGTKPADVQGNGNLKINSVSIVNVPRRAWLDRSDLEYSDIYASTIIQTFSTPLVIYADNSGNSGTESTDVLTFYIPEHNLSDVAHTNGLYTYIQVNGKFTEADGTTETNTSYQIPLGDGISAYNGSSVPTNLPLKDLHISKNTCYKVEASVTSKGKLERFEVKVTPKDWEIPDEIEADLGVPYLNVTSLHVDMSEKEVRVHFWTNQENPYISSDGLMRMENAPESPIIVNDVFNELASASGSQNTNFVYEALPRGGYYGYMSFVFKNADTYINAGVYKLTLNAGKLTRTIEVNSNPIIGKIVFDGNGGQIESQNSYTREIRYAEWLNDAFFGEIYKMSEPTFTPPAGYEFFTWVYSSEDREIDSASGELNIVIGGYITGVKALWKKK